MGQWSSNGKYYSVDPSSELDWVLSNYVEGKSKIGDTYASFCLEINEVFSPGVTYNAVLNNAAVNGGTGSPTVGFDVLSIGTAFLYEQFALGKLEGFAGTNFKYGDTNWAEKLQKTIWWLENEHDGADYYYNYFETLFSLAGITDPRADYTGSAVKVLNLTEVVDGQIIKRQDQLVYLGSVPDGGATVALLGLSMGGIALLRRKFATA